MNDKQDIMEKNCTDEQVGDDFELGGRSIIYLTDKLAVTADKRQYIVGTPKQREGRGPEMKHPRYYPTMALAINGALSTTLRHEVSDGTIDTLDKFLREAERIIDDFRCKLKPYEC